MKTQQTKYELERWLRMLEFIKEENTLLKYRIAEMMHLETEKHLIRQAEDFQKLFLDNDAVIAMLKDDIHRHLQLLSQHTPGDEISTKSRQRYQQVLAGDMDKFEKNFSRLQVDFNTFMDDSFADFPATA